MVTVADVVEQLEVRAITQTANLGATVTGGYVSDLLSCVMAKAQAGNVWVTLQAHPNVVAVASLLELSCVVVTEGTQVESSTIEKAENEGIPILTTPLDSYVIVEKLSGLGIHGHARAE